MAPAKDDTQIREALHLFFSRDVHAHLLYRSSRREFTQVSALERMVLKSVPSHLLERYLTAAPLKSVNVLNFLQHTQSASLTLFVFLAFPATSCFFKCKGHAPFCIRFACQVFTRAQFPITLVRACRDARCTDTSSGPVILSLPWQHIY